MSNQEELRKKRDKILNLVKAWAVIPHPYESPDAEGLLCLLDREGVVIQVDRKLPDKYAIAEFGGGYGMESHPLFDRDGIKEAGYVAFERLIE